MIPTNTNTLVNTNVVELDSSQFNISSNPYIIELLSTKLYDRPNEAVIRELLSNALDSHKEAGVTKPVEISLITTENVTTLEFKDYGSGMSPAKFKEVFVNIGASSKNKSNDQHGGYGIGALTIFAAAEQATLITNQPDLVYTYLLYRDSNNHNVPTANLINSRINTENTCGTSITIPIRSQDLTDVALYLTQLTCMISSKVIVRGLRLPLEFKFESRELRHYKPFLEFNVNKLKGELFNFYYSSLYHKPETNSVSLYVQIGDISYDIDSRPQFVTSLCKKLEEHKDKINLDLIRNFRYYNGSYSHELPAAKSYLSLKFPIGTLDLPGSREYISTTEKNLELISQTLIKAWAEFSNAYADLLDRVSHLSLVTKLTYCSKLNVTHLRVPTKERIGLLRNIKFIDVAALALSCSVTTNIKFSENKQVDKDKVGTLKLKEVTLLAILIKSLELDKFTQIVYYVGPSKDAGPSVRKQFPNKTWFLIRCFETPAELDVQTSLEIDRAIDKVAIIKQTTPTPKKARAAICYDTWASKQNPSGLSILDFKSKELSEHIVKGGGPIDPYALKHYFTHDNYKPNFRPFIKALAKALQVQSTIYYLSPAAAKLVQTDTHQNWEPAFTMFDDRCLTKLKQAIELCRNLEVDPKLCATYGGWQPPESVFSLVYKAEQRSKCIKIVTDAPDLVSIVGKQNVENLQMIAEAYPIVLLFFSTFNHVALSFPKCNKICTEYSSYGTLPHQSPGVSYSKLLTTCLRSLINLTPLVESCALFDVSYQSEADNERKIKAAEAISKSMPTLLALHQHLP